MCNATHYIVVLPSFKLMIRRRTTLDYFGMTQSRRKKSGSSLNRQTHQFAPQSKLPKPAAKSQPQHLS